MTTNEHREQAEKLLTSGRHLDILGSERDRQVHTLSLLEAGVHALLALDTTGHAELAGRVRKAATSRPELTPQVGWLRWALDAADVTARVQRAGGVDADKRTPEEIMIETSEIAHELTDLLERQGWRLVHD